MVFAINLGCGMRDKSRFLLYRMNLGCGIRDKSKFWYAI
jgi:hypothetical protein